MECKHEGKVRWMITGKLTNSRNIWGGKKYSKKQVPVLHCDKCDKDFIVEFKDVGN